MLEVWIQLVVVIKKLKLWIVLLFRLQHDLHLGSLFADERRRFLDDRMDLQRSWLFGNTDQRMKH